MGWIEFVSWPYAAAGAIAALGPLAIHLLNRRRYRTLAWGAMELLRQVARRQRKLLRLRDLVLLALRMLAILLFGLALARPFHPSAGGSADARQPWHAIFVLDNSLSMGYQTLTGTLWSQAQAEARRMIEQLPAGSRVSLIPAAGGWEGLPLRTGEHPAQALETLASIPLVDRSASATAVLPLIRQAQQAVAELPSGVIWIDDAQANHWQDLSAGELRDLPPISHLALGPAERENTWVAAVRLQDGLADIETPATVRVELAYRGLRQPRQVQAELRLDQTPLGQATVQLPAGRGRRELSFEVRFQNLVPLPPPDEARFAPLTVSLTPDALPADDQGHWAAPVVAAAPVVFLDQCAADEEDPLRGRLGETYALRALLAPRTTRSQAPRQLIQVRHLRADQLRAELLADARLVVVAGVRDPEAIVDLLLPYVTRGGPLLVAAGGEFDPARWNAAAWRDGLGLLPLPLAEERIGQLPDEGDGPLEPFSLDDESLRSEPWFQLADVPDEERQQLYAEPLFFQAIRVREEPELLAALKSQLRQDAPAAEAAPTDPQAPATLPSTELAAFLPRVLARFALPGKPPFLVARRVGKGEVLFCASGVCSPWNTLPRTHAMVLFDRILRELLEGTLPVRNVPACDRWALPLPPEAHDTWHWTLIRPPAGPEGTPQVEALEAGYIGPQQRGLVLTGLWRRGLYRVQGGPRREPHAQEAVAAAAGPGWETVLAVHGSQSESDLTSISSEVLAQRLGTQWQRLAPGQMPHPGGVAASSRPWGWWLLVSAGCLLLAEMGWLVAWQTGARVASDGKGEAYGRDRRGQR